MTAAESSRVDCAVVAVVCPDCRGHNARAVDMAFKELSRFRKGSQPLHVRRATVLVSHDYASSVSMACIKRLASPVPQLLSIEADPTRNLGMARPLPRQHRMSEQPEGA
jgi:hypothetical protein